MFVLDCMQFITQDMYKLVMFIVMHLQNCINVSHEVCKILYSNSSKLLFSKSTMQTICIEPHIY